LLNDPGATLSKTKSASPASILVPVTDQGTVSVAGGRLVVSVLTFSGSPSVVGPGELSLGAAGFGSGVGFSGSPTLEVDGSSSVSSAETLGAGGSVVFDGDGSLSGGGSLTVAAGDKVSFAQFTLEGGTRLVNDGSATVQTGFSVDFDGATLENAGSLALGSGSSLADDGGTNLLLNDPGATLSKTKSASPASILVPVTDQGTIRVPEGTLSIAGDYRPAGAAALVITESGATSELSVAGTAALGGTLSIATAAGYLPPVGTEVSVLDATSVSGSFSSIKGAQLVGEHWSVQYTPSSVVLVATSG
jgi:hypothetical protein